MITFPPGVSRVAGDGPHGYAPWLPTPPVPISPLALEMVRRIDALFEIERSLAPSASRC